MAFNSNVLFFQIYLLFKNFFLIHHYIASFYYIRVTQVLLQNHNQLDLISQIKKNILGPNFFKYKAIKYLLDISKISQSSL